VLGSQQRKFRNRIRDLVMPAICRVAGDLQHSAGEAPGIPFDDLERSRGDEGSLVSRLTSGPFAFLRHTDRRADRLRVLAVC
jgi:hypothetical protein